MILYAHMALAGGVKVKNCGKKHFVTLILQNEKFSNMKRGDAAGTGNYVCEDKPIEGSQISEYWRQPYINLDITVTKDYSEVDDPRDGIEVVCIEKCPFNMLRNKES